MEAYILQPLPDENPDMIEHKRKSAEDFEMSSASDNKPVVSVVVCTHNPRADYLDRVLTGLKNQSLSYNEWELLLIDNASEEPLSKRFELTWHANGRYVVEPELGLTPARLRGIRESHADIIVFVDDDNVLAANYLEEAIRISQCSRHIGAFSGSSIAEFEDQPEAWALPYLHLLAIREIKRDTWSNFLTFNDSTPFGAGLCVRRLVAEDYLRKVTANDKRKALGRVGTGTGSAEDSDLAYCAIDLGMGIGNFKSLTLTHLISKRRLTVDYIERLSKGIYASQVVLDSLRQAHSIEATHSKLSKLRFWVKLLTLSPIDRKIAVAAYRGRQRAVEFLRAASADKGFLQA